MGNTVWCRICECWHSPRAKCFDEIKPIVPTVPEFRNDHGPACTCFACVMSRYVRRAGWR